MCTRASEIEVNQLSLQTVEQLLKESNDRIVQIEAPYQMRIEFLEKELNRLVSGGRVALIEELKRKVAPYPYIELEERLHQRRRELLESAGVPSALPKVKSELLSR